MKSQAALWLLCLFVGLSGCSTYDPTSGGPCQATTIHAEGADATLVVSAQSEDGGYGRFGWTSMESGTLVVADPALCGGKHAGAASLVTILDHDWHPISERAFETEFWDVGSLGQHALLASTTAKGTQEFYILDSSARTVAFLEISGVLAKVVSATADDSRVRLLLTAFGDVAVEGVDTTNHPSGPAIVEVKLDLGDGSVDVTSLLDLAGVQSPSQVDVGFVDDELGVLIAGPANVTWEGASVEVADGSRMLLRSGGSVEFSGIDWGGFVHLDGDALLYVANTTSGSISIDGRPIDVLRGSFHHVLVDLDGQPEVALSWTTTERYWPWDVAVDGVIHMVGRDSGDVRIQGPDGQTRIKVEAGYRVSLGPSGVSAESFSYTPNWAGPFGSCVGISPWIGPPGPEAIPLAVHVYC